MSAASRVIRGIKGALQKADTVLKTASGAKSAVRAIDPADTVVEVVLQDDSGKVEVLEEKVKNAVTVYVQRLAAKKAAEESAAEAADILRHYVGVVRTDNAKQGDYQKTYRVIGNKGTAVQYAVDVSENDKFGVDKKVDLNDANVREAIINALGGKDTFDKLFEEATAIGIKDEVLKNEALRKELSALLFKHLGADGIKKYFRRETVWSVREGVDKLQYTLDPEILKEFLEIATQSADTVKDKSEDIN